MASFGAALLLQIRGAGFIKFPNFEFTWVTAKRIADWLLFLKPFRATLIKKSE